MGVDWSNVKQIVAVGAGQITNVYTGLKGFGTTIIERLQSGQYIYYGEETGGGTPQVTPGQQVSGGQQLAPGTGGVIEVGYWNPATGAPVGAPGYVEGQPTAAGQQFRSALGGGGGGVPAVTAPSYVPGPYRSWVVQAANATGMPVSVVAAQINLESGFNPRATSSTGAEGLAQFLPSTFAGLGIQGSPYDPNSALAAYIKYMNQLLAQYNGNIRDALAAYNAGPGNLAAGYGYADSILAKARVNRGATAGAKYGGTRPGGAPATPNVQVSQALQAYTKLRNTPRTAPPGSKNPFTWWYASFSGNWDKMIASEGGI